jgi:hypothetical protein
VKQKFKIMKNNNFPVHMTICVTVKSKKTFNSDGTKEKITKTLEELGLICTSFEVKKCEDSKCKCAGITDEDCLGIQAP